MTPLPHCTIEQLLSWKPCGNWPEKRIRRLARGRAAFDACDVLRLRIDPAARLWVVLREEMIPAPLLHEFACRCAETVLPLYEAQYPQDARPRDAIAAKRAWLRGEITDAQLAAAWDAAESAAMAAAASAARSAAASAARSAAMAAAASAARSAAASAARSAAWSAAGKEQCRLLLALLREEAQ